MNSEDREKQASAAPPYDHHLRHRHPLKKLTALAYQTFSQPKAFILLLIVTFILGYFSHSQTSPPSDPLFSSVAADDLFNHNNFPTQCSDSVSAAGVRQTVLDRVFNGTSPWENFPPPHVRPLLLLEWTKGWGSNAPVFENLINQVHPKIIIEVGTFLGASAIHMAGLTQKLGLDSLILCIDDFRGWPGYQDEEKSLKTVNGNSLLLYQFMQNVAKANATDQILYLPFSTSTALGGLCQWGVYGDLVEVDAAHDFHSAWVDINNAFKVLKPGGVLFGHDYVWEGVQKAVHIFARLNGFRVRIDGEHWVLY